MPNVNNTNVSPQTKAIKNSYPQGGFSLSLGTNKPLYSPTSTSNSNSTTSSVLSPNGMAPKTPLAQAPVSTTNQQTSQQAQYKSTGANAGTDPYTLKPYSAPTVSTPPAQSATPSVTPEPSQSLYQQAVSKLATTASQPSQQYTDYTNKAEQAYKTAGDTNQIIQRSQSDALHNPNYSLDTGIGRAGQIQQNYGQQGANALTQAQGYGSLANTALSQENRQQSGQASVAGYTAPQPYGLTTQPYNPVTDNYGGGGPNGAIDRSIQASNIGSAGDFQSKIQTTQAQANAADANFDILNGYAQGFAGDVPITNALKQKYGTSVEGNQAVAGFQAQLQNVRSAYQAITGGDAVSAIPDNITPNQLRQVQSVLKSTAQNNVAGYQKQLQGLGSNTQQTPGTGGKVVQTKAGPINIDW